VGFREAHLHIILNTDLKDQMLLNGVAKASKKQQVICWKP
jgi:hypothetical protein